MEYDGVLYERPSHLPPDEAWKVDPHKLKKFFAPTDDRGFVLPEATIEAIKELFVDDYHWPLDTRFQQSQPDIHHFHWMGRLYEPNRYRGSTVPRAFRNLPTVLGIIPRQFHDVVHKVTLPPNKPKYADMEAHLEAYQLARRLFQSAQVAAATQELLGSSDEIAYELLAERFKKQFKGYRANVDVMVKQAALDALRFDIPKFEHCPPEEMAKILGRLSVAKVPNYAANLPTRPLAIAA